MNLRKYLVLKNYRNYLHDRFGAAYKKSYSQCGEDILIGRALSMLGIRQPNYLEIGTNYPVAGNNTYSFYAKGAHGVCVEPDPDLAQMIRQTRPRDTCLNVGIGPSEEAGLSFYMLSKKGLNTFSKEEAEKTVKDGMYGEVKIEKVITVPLVTIDSVIEKHFPAGVDILSLDAEGYDFNILQSLDFVKHRPKLICVETARYDEHRKLQKETEMIDFVLAQDYFLYADTFVNSIFVDKKVWSL